MKVLEPERFAPVLIWATAGYFYQTWNDFASILYKLTCNWRWVILIAWTKNSSSRLSKSFLKPNPISISYPKWQTLNLRPLWRLCETGWKTSENLDITWLWQMHVSDGCTRTWLGFWLVIKSLIFEHLPIVRYSFRAHYPSIYPKTLNF